jgi:hypothetical protein
MRAVAAVGSGGRSRMATRRLLAVSVLAVVLGACAASAGAVPLPDADSGLLGRWNDKVAQPVTFLAYSPSATDGGQVVVTDTNAVGADGLLVGSRPACVLVATGEVLGSSTPTPRRVFSCQTAPSPTGALNHRGTSYYQVIGLDGHSRPLPVVVPRPLVPTRLVLAAGAMTARPSALARDTSYGPGFPMSVRLPVSCVEPGNSRPAAGGDKTGADCRVSAEVRSAGRVRLPWSETSRRVALGHSSFEVTVGVRVHSAATVPLDVNQVNPNHALQLDRWLRGRRALAVVIAVTYRDQYGTRHQQNLRRTLRAPTRYASGDECPYGCVRP